MMNSIQEKIKKGFAIRFKEQEQSQGLLLLSEPSQVWITAVLQVDVRVMRMLPMQYYPSSHDYRLFILLK